MTNDAFAEAEIFIEIETPLEFRVRTTVDYWELITTVKHPSMRGCEADVQLALANPDEVRLSKSDPQVYLFYRADGERRWVCAVSRRLNSEGFLITAYRTKAIKVGTVVWHK